MNHHDVIGDGLSDLIIKLHIHKEVDSDCLQSILGPGEEPVDAGVGD
jgi:hypothetical protein